MPQNSTEHSKKLVSNLRSSFAMVIFIKKYNKGPHLKKDEIKATGMAALAFFQWFFHQYVGSYTKG